MKVDLGSISGQECMKTIFHLDGLGIRFAGTRGEKKAARWVERQFKKLGLTGVHQQEFPCLSCDYTRCVLSALLDGRWWVVDSEPAAHSKPTPEAGVEAELVVVEKIPGNARECRSLMQGKILLLYNSELFQLENFKRVMGAAPAGILLVDDRFPNDWTVAIGFPRYWIDFISCPVVNVPYTDAWEMVRQGVAVVRLEVESYVKEAISQNVIGEIRGRGSAGEVIVVSAHHDSVLNNPGADDNCTGVAAVLELARVFSKMRPRRTLRFISYGAEEQLSEGAKFYAFNTKDVRQIQFVLNIDSIGAWMGRTGIYYAGPRALEKTVEKVNQEMEFPGHLIQELSPFSDHFPLNLCGVPAVWYYRTTYVAARHYHHSALETPDVVSEEVLEATVRQQAALLERIANEEPMPFPRRIPSHQMKTLRQMAKEWCGIEDLPS
ncbi:M28 family metallopeptidase [Acidobacteria bacterium AH-259-G07]|nr:M28 family metallopeptidase [Acidobacteria bacterium AH-259-G07]